MTPIERLRKLLAEATVPYSKPSIVFKDNARVIVWAENEKGRDIATFRHNVTMESDATLYIEAVRMLPALLAAYDADRAFQAFTSKNVAASKMSSADMKAWNDEYDRLRVARDSAVARVEGSDVL